MEQEKEHAVFHFDEPVVVQTFAERTLKSFASALDYEQQGVALAWTGCQETHYDAWIGNAYGDKSRQQEAMFDAQQARDMLAASQQECIPLAALFFRVGGSRGYGGVKICGISAVFAGAESELCEAMAMWFLRDMGVLSAAMVRELAMSGNNEFVLENIEHFNFPAFWTICE